MTRQEITNRRPSFLSGWIRTALTDSKDGLTVHDVDFVLYNYKTKKIMIIEEKTMSEGVTFSQKDVINIIHRALQKGLGEEYTYLGYHLITFKGRDFSDEVHFDHDLVEEEELIRRLTF